MMTLLPIFLLSLTMKELWKSARICWSCRQGNSGIYFDSLVHFLCSSLCFGFVDLEKAFDGASREVIRWAMYKLGVDELSVSAVMSVYVGAQTVVRTVHGNLRWSSYEREIIHKLWA